MADIKLKNTANTEFSISHNGTRGAKAVTSDQIVVAVETINDFPANAETGDTVIVKDMNRGGTFIYDATQSAVNNSGTIFDGWVRQYSGAVNVKWFGAKGGFDPQNATDSSLNSVESFQKAIDFCIEHKLNLTTEKDSFLIKRNGDPFGNSLNIGNYNATDLDVLNITIDLQGSTLYQGDLGSLFLVAKVSGVEFKNINYVGYATDSNWHPSRENYGLMKVNYSSSNITINSCSFRNFMGDAIYIGGTLVAGGELDEQCHNIIIKNCTFKERLGNNIRPYETGGTRSRLAIACITAEKVKIFDNIFYGAIDFEPNLDNQVLRDIEVINNTFYDLKVIPHSTLNNWEEEIHSESGELILNNIRITGVAGNPVVENVLFSNNTFDTGTISTHSVYRATVSYNRFRSGTITIGTLTGSGTTKSANIIGNRSDSSYSTDGFLKIAGNLNYCLLSNNSLIEGNLIHVIPEVSSLERCVFCNNSVFSLTGTLSNINFYTFSGLVLANNTSVDAIVNPSIFTGIETRSLVTPLVTLNIDSTSPLTLNMLSTNIAQASKLYIVPPASTSVTIQDLSNAKSGQTLTIMSGGSGGGGNIIMDSGKFKHIAGGSLTLTANKCVSYMSRGGYWWEI